MENKDQIILKIGFCGDKHSGKSSIIQRFLNEGFELQYRPTIGLDFSNKIIFRYDKEIKLQLWEIQEQFSRYRVVTSNYYKYLKAIICVYDITDRLSYDFILEKLQSCFTNQQIQTIFLIVGTKCDLSDQRQVLFDEAKQISQQYGAFFFEVSSKNSLNINNLFDKVIYNMLERI